MPTKTRYTYSQNEITCILKDSYYIWIAFKGSGESCILSKVSAFDCNIKYYDLTIAANEIVQMTIDGDYLYCALSSGTNNIAVKIHKSDSLSETFIYSGKPAGETENAVDSIAQGAYLYVLMPGVVSGEEAKIHIYSTADMSFSQTGALTGVNNAKTITKDDNNNLWVASEDDPMKLVKYDSGAVTIYEIT